MTADPFTLFESWYADAEKNAVVNPFSIALATASGSARPSLRMVYFRGIREGGFSFFTNYNSRKGREIEENPFAAMLFYWPHAGKQVRVEGRVERLSTGESDAYFQSRPLESRITAALSRQSEVLTDEESFASQVRELETRAADAVARPDHWGGYRLMPAYFEFWISREHRRHSRTAFTRTSGGWTTAKLYP
jgi:pyridoxamine 5'-phosphate oxidase